LIGLRDMSTKRSTAFSAALWSAKRISTMAGGGAMPVDMSALAHETAFAHASRAICRFLQIVKAGHAPIL
jgi:hypothetical protein